MRATVWTGMFLALCSSTLACSTSSAEEGTADAGSDTTGVGNAEFPEQAAERICGFLFECSCDDPGYADEATCLTEVGDATRFDHEKAQNAGLTYDPTCGQGVLDAYDMRACAIALVPGAPTCFDPCRRYVGEKAVGEACGEIYLDWHDCQQGLICAVEDGGTERVCQDPCGAAIPGGGMCIDAMGAELGTCAPGNYCDSVLEVCTPWPEPGQACGAGNVCSFDHFCDQTGMSPVCRVKRAEDDPCSYPDWCADGLYCEPTTDLCTTLPTAGQDCALGGACDSFSVCEMGTCVFGEAIACAGVDALAG